MDEEVDWLDDVSATQARKDQERQAIEDAQPYLLFVDDERGRQLMQRWDRDLWNLRTPPDAPIQQYAADEALRAFIARLKIQIELAQRRMDV